MCHKGSEREKGLRDRRGRAGVAGKSLAAGFHCSPRPLNWQEKKEKRGKKEKIRNFSKKPVDKKGRI